MMLSLFPDEMVNNPMNPASIFVWFISAKQYFSVITRKIVENYKLNLFDIALDPFEVKIWFWESPTIKVKDVDFYYWYAAAANLNGFRSYAPWQLAHAITMIASVYLQEIIDEEEDFYWAQFLYTIYLLTFIFQSRLKVFPWPDIQRDFSWFIEVLFSLYEFMLVQSWKKYTKSIVEKYKMFMLKTNMHVLFMLYYFYKYSNQILDIPGVQLQQFYGWLYYDELKWWALQPLVQDLLKNIEISSISTTFSTTEKNIVHLLFPADILLRYIYDGDSLWVTIRHFVHNFFGDEKVDSYVKSFLSDWSRFEEFIWYISDYTNFRTKYFDAMKKYITHVFQKWAPTMQINENEKIDERMSTIGEGWNIDMNNVPLRLKQESEAMERLMNFYITYVGWYRLWRWDSRYIRGFWREVIAEIMKCIDKTNKHDAYYYYSWLLYSYSKNVFYYKYAFENIRAGKDRFHLPFRATFREVYSNICIIKLFESSFIAGILQDLLAKDIKLYSKNTNLIALFWERFGEKISALVRLDNKEIIQKAYEIYDPYFDWFVFSALIQNHFWVEEITSFKENLYTPDYWIYKITIEHLHTIIHILQEKYGNASILWILHTLRETLMGLYLYAHYVIEKNQKKGIDDHINELLKIYCVDVLNMSDDFIAHMIPVFKHMLITYHDLFSAINSTDDNHGYHEIAAENRSQYCYGKRAEDIFWWLSGEDIIRFRWYLKTVTYYNKRYITPHH